MTFDCAQGPSLHARSPRSSWSLVLLRIGRPSSLSLTLWISPQAHAIASEARHHRPGSPKICLKKVNTFAIGWYQATCKAKCYRLRFLGFKIAPKGARSPAPWRSPRRARRGSATRATTHGIPSEPTGALDNPVAWPQWTAPVEPGRLPFMARSL